MMGRFNAEQRLSADGESITTLGPIDWSSLPDVGDEIVRIDVEFTQNGHTCGGHSRNRTFRRGTDTEWVFDMDNNDMSTGPVQAHAEARMRNGSRVSWDSDASRPVAIVAN